MGGRMESRGGKSRSKGAEENSEKDCVGWGPGPGRL